MSGLRGDVASWGQVPGRWSVEGLGGAVLESPEEEYDAPAGDSPPHTAEPAMYVAVGFLSVAGPGGGAEAEAVLLVVRELVTNAQRHAGGGDGVRAGGRCGNGDGCQPRPAAAAAR